MSYIFDNKVATVGSYKGNWTNKFGLYFVLLISFVIIFSTGKTILLKHSSITLEISYKSSQNVVLLSGGTFRFTMYSGVGPIGLLIN